MSIHRLREFTTARVNLGRAGGSLPTGEFLKLQLAHASAREAVHSKLDTHSLGSELKDLLGEVLFVHSAAPDRPAYLRRPDLGRRLAEPLTVVGNGFDAVFIVADGLSALAVQRHAAPVIEHTLSVLDRDAWRMAPAVIVEQGRVAIGDEIGHDLGCALSVVFIGERPGLSSPDSLGIYLTWHPKRGLTDARRNCISNVHANGLSYSMAAHKLAFLMNESRRRKLSGVHLKEEAVPLLRLPTPLLNKIPD